MTLVRLILAASLAAALAVLAGCVSGPAPREPDPGMAERKLAQARDEARRQRDADLLAAVRAGDVAAAARLLDAGADPDGAARAGWKPGGKEGPSLLHTAALAGSGPMVDLLIARGLDVNATDVLGDTPLHAAAHAGRDDIAAHLRAAGADGDRPNRSGLLHWEMEPLGEIERLVDRATALINVKSGGWTDWRTGRRLYDALKRRSPRHVVYGLVRNLAYRGERRPQVLLLSIKLGLPDSARQLNDLLMRHGSRAMAEDYLNSGSRELAEGGRAWAAAHGYTIHAGPGSHRSSWGRF